MRLPLLPPSSLSSEQKDLYDDIMGVVNENFGSFMTARNDGALIGPFNLSSFRSRSLGHEQDDVSTYNASEIGTSDSRAGHRNAALRKISNLWPRTSGGRRRCANC